MITAVCRAFLVLIFCLSLPLSAFVEGALSDATEALFPSDQASGFAYGFHHGGGGFLGIDYERQIQDNWSWAAGVGFESVGFQIRYHLEPGIKGSFWSAGLWHQGFGNGLQRILGVTYGYRHKTLPYTFQLGLGAVTDRGSSTERTLQEILETDALSDVVFIYSLGYHFSL